MFRGFTVYIYINNYIALKSRRTDGPHQYGLLTHVFHCDTPALIYDNYDSVHSKPSGTYSASIIIDNNLCYYKPPCHLLFCSICSALCLGRKLIFPLIQLLSKIVQCRIFSNRLSKLTKALCLFVFVTGIVFSTHAVWWSTSDERPLAAADPAAVEIPAKVEPSDRTTMTYKSTTFRSYLPFAPVSKDVTVHRAYFDDRHGRTESGWDHASLVVFFIDVSLAIFKHDWIVGCGVGDKRADKFLIRVPAASLAHDPLNVPFKYQHLYVDCFDLPVHDGDRAFLLYKTSEDQSDPIVVESDLPVVFPAKSVRTSSVNKYANITVVSCIKANSHIAPFLGELLQYQKSIGVDHVSLITISSFIKDGGLKSLLIKHPYIIDYFIKGYITVDTWKEFYDETEEAHEIRLFSESIRKVACSFNHRGTYDYAIPIDTDDFFTPRVPGETNIKYYLKKYCYEEHIGSCKLKWITYYPGFYGLNNITSDGNVTKALKSHVHCVNHVAKSIHRTSALIDATFHEVRIKWHNMMPGYKVVNVPSTICVMAHMRMFARPNQKKCNYG